MTQFDNENQPVRIPVNDGQGLGKDALRARQDADLEKLMNALESNPADAALITIAMRHLREKTDPSLLTGKDGLSGHDLRYIVARDEAWGDWIFGNPLKMLDGDQDGYATSDELRTSLQRYVALQEELTVTEAPPPLKGMGGGVLPALCNPPPKCGK